MGVLAWVSLGFLGKLSELRLNIAEKSDIKHYYCVGLDEDIGKGWEMDYWVDYGSSGDCGYENYVYWDYYTFS